METSEAVASSFTRVDAFEQIRVNISSMAQKSKSWEVTVSKLHS
ncbi:hypothetical protein AB0759_24820 [Scytonema tolypothrichoides VB-61278_2]